MSSDAQSRIPPALWTAFWLNFVWINVSEVARYFLLVRPMLQETFPMDPAIGAINLPTFAIWGLWDLILIAGATGFYWLWLDRFGRGLKQVIIASTALSVFFFGLIWLGIFNMGLAPIDFLIAALPLAWIEQLIACAIVAWAMRKTQSSPSMRSI